MSITLNALCGNLDVLWCLRQRRLQCTSVEAGRTRSQFPRADHDRVAELDGLRAVAVVPVIALHFGAAVNGGAGVTVFFALSGYLITTLLMAEHAERGRIDLRRFYSR